MEPRKAPRAYQVHINYVSVMRRAPDAGEFRPCDPLLESEDKERKKYVLKEVGCMPRFWNDSVTGQHIENYCNYTMIESIYRQYNSDSFDKKAGLYSYQPACDKMSTSYNIEKHASNIYGIEGEVEMVFFYPGQGKILL